MSVRIKSFHSIVSALTTVLLSAACVSLQAQERISSIDMQACELQVPGTPLSVSAECGWLQVAENPQQPEGEQIQLRIARIPASGRTPEPDPLVFFAGGPGQSALETWPMMARAFSRVTQSRDVLLVDQRGTGQSNPMKCESGDFEAMLSGDWSDLEAQTRACLEQTNGDPRFYTTTIAMHDMEAVRAAMGYEQLNLYGGSYGTRAAQVYLRLYPDRVRSLVLDGVVPPDLVLGTEHAEKLDQAINRVLNGCDADPACHAAFPNTPRKLRDLMSFVSENPQATSVTHPTTGKSYDLTFDRDTLAASLRFLTYSAEAQAMLPLLINEAATDNRYDRLASQMLIATSGLQQSIAMGMSLAVTCAEDWPLFTAPEQPEHYLMGDAMYKVTQLQCGIWPAGERPEDFHLPVTSTTPALLLSGERDPVTPPEYGTRTAHNFSNSLHLIAKGQGHITATRGCMGRIVADFINGTEPSELETECVDELQAAPYFLDLTGPTP